MMNEDTVNPLDQRGWLAACVLLITVLVVYAMLGIWNRPLADDSCIIATVDRVGVIGYVQQTWWNWTGNVPSLLLQAVGTTTGWYGWWPGALLAIWAIGFVWLAHESAKILRINVPLLVELAVGTAQAIAVNDMTGNRYQTLYWLTGTFAYALPAALTLILGATVLRAARQGIRRSHVLAVVLLSFVIGACSPTNAAFLLFLLAAGWLGAFMWARDSSRRRLNVLIGVAMIGAVVAAFIILVSPGNALRQTALAEYGIHRQPFLKSVVNSGLYSLIIVERTIRMTAPVANVILVVLGMSSAMLFRPDALRYRAGSRTAGRLGFPLLLFSGLIVTAAAVFPAALSTGNLPEPRLWIIPQGVWALLVFGFSYLVGLSVVPPRSSSQPRLRLVMFGALFMLCIAQIPDIIDQWRTIRTYASDFDTRYDLVTAAVDANAQSVSIPPYSTSVYEFAQLGNAFEDDCWQQRFPQIRLEFERAVE